MVRMGLKVRGLRRANGRMRAELTVLRTVVGQDHQLVQAHRERDKQLQGQLKQMDESFWNQNKTREELLQKVREVEIRLERVPRWVRWLFGAA